ncbi:MAG: glycosyltransferase [candidate division Zixibacteria bacterium]|nr:glycosyltransferase [candidate division Zixibacteria bacterium]
MAEVIFFVSIGLIFYTYIGYPILLRLMPKEKPILKPSNGNFAPPVSIIIAAYQGASAITQKLDNTFASNYPADKLQVIVISDGSQDGTDAVVESYPDNRVSLIRQIPRMGKTAAQKRGIAAAKYDIVIFTDLTTMLEPDSVKNLVSALYDTRIGLASSEDLWVSPDGARTESAQGAYVRYEMWLRDTESAVSSIVSASGCFYAVRKEYFEAIPDHLIDDIVIPMTVVERGSRGVHIREARSLVPMIPSAEREFTRRARMTLGGINALAYKYHLLNPFRFGFYSVQLLSHKLLRWFIPFFMIAAFISTALLALKSSSSVWIAILIVQILFYTVAYIGYLQRRQQSNHKIIKLIYFFTSSNLALISSWYQFFTKSKQTTWSESRS